MSKIDERAYNNIGYKLQAINLAFKGLHMMLDEGEPLAHLDVSSVEKIFDELHADVLETLSLMEASHE